jgi:hypothetical protein
MGRPPISKTAMAPAERQRRFRAKHGNVFALVTKPQLIGAYNELIKAHNELFDAFDELMKAHSELIDQFKMLLDDVIALHDENAAVRSAVTHARCGPQGLEKLGRESRSESAGPPILYSKADF